jgi:hypothetical protein
MKEAVKDTASSSGIMSINKSISDKVEKQLQKYVSDAMQQGVDLDALSPEQLKMIVQINKPKPPRVIPADSLEGRGITQALFGKRGDIIDFPQKRSFKQEVDDMIKDGTITKGNVSKQSDKVKTRQMFKDSNLNKPRSVKTEAELKAEIEAGNKKAVKNLGNKRQLTEDEYQDFLDEIGGADQLDAYYFDGTVGSANKIKKEQKDYMSQMEMEFRKGKLDPEPGSRTPQRKRFLQNKLDEAEASGDARLLSREEREELFDLDDIEDFAYGGVAGMLGERQNFAMGRRAFLKLMGGLGAGIGALKTGLLGLGGKQATKEVAKELITTPAASGKPAWFDALVTRVIREGDDVTKTMATKDRQNVFIKKIDDETEVMVTQDLDEGVTRIDIEDSVRNVTGFDDPPTVSLQVTDEIVEEGGVRTKPQFKATENDYRNYATDPDGGYETEFVENTVENTKDLTSDLTKVKSFATKKGPTMKEIVGSKKRKDNVKYAQENPSSYAADRGPDYDPSDYIEDMADDFASGGIARMLGE